MYKLGWACNGHEGSYTLACKADRANKMVTLVGFLFRPNDEIGVDSLLSQVRVYFVCDLSCEAWNK